jgi:para-aminobenzoate synthetase
LATRPRWLAVAMVPVRTLLIDNYDSYTFNLFQLLQVVNDGVEPVVITNDQLDWDELNAILPAFDCVIISPGPGRPERYTDFGVSTELLAFGQVPILGVCLGHQGIAHCFGGVVEHSPTVWHGRLSAVLHAQPSNGSGGLLDGIPSPFQVVRYHSLRVKDLDLPANLRVLARAQDDGSIMALEHTSRPIWGVQFHPESVCTAHGDRILSNFAHLALQANRQ